MLIYRLNSKETKMKNKIIAIMIAIITSCTSISILQVNSEENIDTNIIEETINIYEYLDSENYDKASITAVKEDKLSNNTHFEAGEVPRIYINTINNVGLSLVKKDGYVTADITIVNTDGQTIHESGQIRVRGNTTANAEKKPYNIKFDSKQNVLGMGKAKKWVLLASCFDPTFLRNMLVLDLSQKIGIPYTSDHYYTELWIDGVYRGCYELTEPVDDGLSRVNIDVDSNNGMADFLVQYEKSRIDSDSSYVSADELRFEVKSPNITSEEQRLYIEQKLTDVFKVIKTCNFEEIEKIIDVDSFAKYYLINEIFKNVDFGWSSAFFYYKNGILYAGPPWDYDLTAGNLNPNFSFKYQLCLDTANLYCDNCHFYKYLLQCRDFQNTVRHVYVENFEHIESMYAEYGIIDTMIEKYYPVFQRNFDDTDWNITTIYSTYMRTPDSNYFENVEYLRNWLSKRNQWLSEYYDIYGEDWYTLGDIDGNSKISIADAVLLQKWLLAVPGTKLSNWKAADLCKDGRIDVFDLCLLKRTLIQ